MLNPRWILYMTQLFKTVIWFDNFYAVKPGFHMIVMVVKIESQAFSTASL